MKHLWLPLLLALSWGANAQTFPTKSVRIIEPAGPGSAVDVFARKLGIGLADKWGQPVVIENRPGGNSAIGAREAARAAPDGYTIFHANINNSLNDILAGDACCKLNEALIPITLLTSTPLVMVVNPGVGVKINRLAGLSIQEIPYKAIGAELPDLIAGHVKTAYLAPVVVSQHIRSGKLVAIGVAGSHRIPILPDVPTLAEAGLADAQASGWNGLFVPAGTPRAIVQKLQADIASVVQALAFKAEALDLGHELGGGSAEDFSAYIKSEVNRWGRLIKDANIKAL